MAAGYILTASDIQYQYVRMSNYWKGLLGTTNMFLQRLADLGSTAITNAYQAGGSATFVQDLVDLSAATTAMTNIIEYAQYVGTTSKTDNTGGAGLSNPTAGPTVTPQGTPGSQTDFYQTIAHTLNGTTLGSTATPTTGSPGSGVSFTTTGAASKNGTNYNLLTNYAVSGATLYDHLWWNGSAWQLVGSTTKPAFQDTGQARSAYTVPTSNTTAGSAQSVSVPNGSFCVVTSDPVLVALLKPVGSDQSALIRIPSDLTAGTL